MPTLRSVIQKEFERQGWSVRQLAEAADVPFSSVQRYLAGEMGLRVDKLERIVKALGLRLIPKDEEGGK